MKRLLIFICLILASLCLLSCSSGDKIDIEDYAIVISKDADRTTKYSAECFVGLLEEKTGAELTVITDDTPETECEILIGETNREASKTNTSLADKQYLLFKTEKKIVMQGYGIYVGGACGDFVNKYTSQSENIIDITNVPAEPVALDFEFSDTHKNVIFMIGDGMGENHILMAEKSGMSPFVARAFPNKLMSVTRSQSVINGEAKFTDSAASGTAMSTGYKTMNGYIGLDKNGAQVKNVRELAYEIGAKTAVVTTDVITGATPSAYMCHNISRQSEEELQTEIDRLVSEGKIDYCAGDVAENLTSELKKALTKISSNGSSFFIMLEEGIIDKASHSKDEEAAVEYVKRFDDAIEYATQFTLCHPDTALIVTADHETGNLTEASSAPCGYYFLYHDHTNKDVPVFAIGAGTQALAQEKIENTDLARFCAKAYTSESFGQSESVE